MADISTWCFGSLYRPTSWENPYSEAVYSPRYLNRKCVYTGRDINQRREQSFEYGASAMLEAIVKLLKDP